MSLRENKEALRPGTSNQGDSQPAPNVPMDSLPLILQHIKSYFGPSKINGKIKCELCNKEIRYSLTSNYNLKSHYKRQHCGEYPNLVAALTAGCKRGRHSSRPSSDTSPARPSALKKRQSIIESAFKERFDQMKALELYYTFFIKDIVPAHLTDSHAFREFMNYVKPDFNVPTRKKLTQDIVDLTKKMVEGPDSRSGPAGLCGIEAVVPAASAATTSSSGGSKSNTTVSNSGGMVVTSDGAATSLPVLGGGGMVESCQRLPVIGMSPPSAPTAPNKPKSYQLRHNHLSLVLNQLAEDEAFMDVTLTAEGRQVKAHKSVLSAVSPYFSAVLRANPCQHPIIIMPRDIRFSELSSIIMYIYKGEITVSADDLPSLLKTAGVLRIAGLNLEENSNSQQYFSKHSSSGSGSNAYLSCNFDSVTTVNNQNSESISVFSFNNSSNNVAMTSQGSNSSRQQQQPSPQQQRPQEQQHSNRTEKISKPPTTKIEFPPPPDHAMLNQSDILDLDMICVKEEWNSDNEEQDPETSSREETTPPPVGNPLSLNKDKASYLPHSQPTLGIDSYDTRPARSPTPKTDSTSQEADDMKLNSLKTLANLANLDTPTNLSPSDSSSPSSACYDPRPNVCPYCSEYITGDQIKAHLSTKHVYKPAHLCNTCFRVYIKKNAFELHSKECDKES